MLLTPGIASYKSMYIHLITVAVNLELKDVPADDDLPPPPSYSVAVTRDLSSRYAETTFGPEVHTSYRDVGPNDTPAVDSGPPPQYRETVGQCQYIGQCLPVYRPVSAVSLYIGQSVRIIGQYVGV